jgi:hypothetical protein
MSSKSEGINNELSTISYRFTGNKPRKDFTHSAQGGFVGLYQKMQNKPNFNPSVHFATPHGPRVTRDESRLKMRNEANLTTSRIQNRETRICKTNPILPTCSLHTSQRATGVELKVSGTNGGSLGCILFSPLFSRHC